LKESNKYILSREKLQKENEESLFALFLNSDYHLNRYEYGFSTILEMFNTSTKELKKNEDLLSRKKAYSWFWFEYASGVNWDDAIQSLANEIQIENFKISIPLILSERPVKILWQPMENLYCKVLIEKIILSGINNSIEISPRDITHNGINIEDGWVEFLRLNDIFIIPFNENWIPNSIQIVGKWKCFEQWQLGERFQGIMEEKQKELDIILNSKAYSIASWFVRKLAWTKNWLRAK
jgi:hypothetical protein